MKKKTVFLKITRFKTRIYNAKKKKKNICDFI